MLKKKTYYKILTRDLTSINGIINISYKEHEWMRPVKGTDGLFAFDNLDDALNFKNKYLHAVLYTCDVTFPRKIKIILNPAADHDLDEDNIMCFWRKRRNKQKIDSSITFHAPKGTVLCDAIKLLQKIS